MSNRASRLLVVLTALGCITYATSAQGQSSGYNSPSASTSDPTTIERAIDQASRRFENTFNAGDPAGAAREFYARDAFLLPPGSATVQGREKIADYWVASTTAAQAGVRRVQLSTLEVQPIGDGASEIGHGTLTLANGKAVTVRYLIVWKKENGVWRRYQDIWNMDTN